MKSSKPFEWPVVMLGMALILGAAVRFLPVIMAGFPLNDGGMFHVMIEDLIANDFRLPLFTTYNFADIPYAYPPFGFYFAALLKVFLGVPVMESLRWLPSLVNIISIYTVYLLGSALLDDRPRGALAAAFFALTPGSYGWFIMGGGLTRALGGLFLVLSVYFLYRVFQRGTSGEVIAAGLFCVLAVLSHPEAGLHTAASCALTWIFWGRTRRGTVHALSIAAATILLTAPWWVSLLAGHGPAPFISAFHAGLYGSPPLAGFARDFFARDALIPILLILRAAGLIWSLWKRRFFLPAWSFLPYFVEPRSAGAVSFYPFTMLIALGLADAAPAFIRILRRQMAERNEMPFAEYKWMNAAVFLVILYCFIGSAFFSFPLVNTTLRENERDVMRWIKENTPAEARFLILTGEKDAMVDPVQEWFPALAERRSQTTLQGYEWTLAGQFSVRWEELSALQGCETVSCVEEWAQRIGADFDYLMVKTDTVPAGLSESLAQGPYALIYRQRQILVFAKEWSFVHEK